MFQFTRAVNTRMSLDEFLKTCFFPNGDRITWSTIRTHSRYDGYDNQVGSHSLIEPTIAEIFFKQNTREPNKFSKCKNVEATCHPIIPGRKLKPVILSHHMLYGRGSPTGIRGKGVEESPSGENGFCLGGLSAVKILRVFFQDRIGSPSKSRDFFGDGQKLSLKSHLLKCSIRNSGSQGFYAFVQLIFVEIKSPHLYLLGFA